MKKHIVLGASLLLMLGTAVASTLIYGDVQPESTPQAYEPIASSASPQPTAEMIAMWKASAISSEYIAPKAPI